MNGISTSIEAYLEDERKRISSDRVCLIILNEIRSLITETDKKYLKENEWYLSLPWYGKIFKSPPSRFITSSALWNRCHQIGRKNFNSAVLELDRVGFIVVHHAVDDYDVTTISIGPENCETL